MARAAVRAVGNGPAGIGQLSREHDCNPFADVDDDMMLLVVVMMMMTVHGDGDDDDDFRYLGVCANGGSGDCWSALSTWPSLPFSCARLSLSLVSSPQKSLLVERLSLTPNPGALPRAASFSVPIKPSCDDAPALPCRQCQLPVCAALWLT